jgi:DMSO/TMAO reductase YedYZ molybdopterin-dependent catalytic subunit
VARAPSAPHTLDLPQVVDETGLEPEPRLYPEELQLAFRNRALPLEALRYEPTPTGLHYTLVHYDIPYLEADSWRLTVGGRVRRPLALDLAALQRRPTRSLRVTLECAGDGRALLQPRPVGQPWLWGAVGTAEWTGTPLRPLLEEAGLEADAREVVFTGHDRGVEGGLEQDYQRALSLAEAAHDEVLLAWAMNGAPLEPQHGFPLRLVVPGWYGMTSVKWLRSIDVVAEPFAGYQQDVSYRYSAARAEPGTPVTLMRVRSLLIPPGIPDFLTRVRVVRRGRVELSGRAWSGRSPIVAVQVSADGGATWDDAEVDPPSNPHTWQGWRFTWQPKAAGACELCCRARDAAGNQQPVEAFWTARGMGNNTVHRVPVLVV